MNVPVLIVGGGPVGLGTALELAWRGVPSMLVERTDGAIDNPKTGHISIRSMEIFRRLGIADRIRHCGFPHDYALSMVFCTSLTGHTLARHPYPSMADDPVLPFAPERKQRAPQLYSDPILARAVRDSGRVDVRYGVEFVDFEQTPLEVISQIRSLATGETTQVRSQYLVACDGAASGIRSQLGIALEGDRTLNYSIAIHCNVPDLLARHDKGEAERYIFVGPEGTWGNLTVVDGRTRWRLTVMGSAERIERAQVDPAYWMRRCFGTDDIPYQLLGAYPWRRSRLVAARYREGRVFLVGDSAHQMSPTGGFGMNTGIGEAADLAWKLDAALAGWGGPALLASYDAERRPIAWRNVNAAADNFHAMMSATDCSRIDEASAAGEAVRARVGANLRLATQKEWESYGVVLGYRYEGSTIIVPDGTPAPSDDPSDYVQTARPGHRAPHAWLGDGRSTLDLFGRGFTLLRFDETADATPIDAAAAARGVPLARVDIADATIARLYAAKLVLVRPDGHVAWRGNAAPADALQMIDTVRGA